jgi:hypothetical protein
MLNRTEPAGEIARVRYGDAEFTIVTPGRFVRCAVSGALVALEDLRYWSVELQEAYRGPAEAMQRWRETQQ